MNRDQYREKLQWHQSVVGATESSLDQVEKRGSAKPGNIDAALLSARVGGKGLVPVAGVSDRQGEPKQ